MNLAFPSKPPVKNQSPREADFIFNDQPFSYQKLAFGEKCRGCNLQIPKNEMALRHREKVARNNVENPPLISQWYHLSIECLRARGFSNRYLSSSKCYPEDINDQFQYVENLIKCGFHRKNIERNIQQIQETFGFQAEAKTPNICNEKKLFVKNSDNSLARCEGCSLQLTPGQSCFIYSSTPTQDSNSRLFHIRRSCLENRFSREDIRGMSCVTINMEDVSPNEIINCGVFNIISYGNYVIPSDRNRNDGGNKPQKPKWKPITFKVDIIDDARSICCTCKKSIPLDKYALKMTTHEKRESLLHLNPLCVEKLAISPKHISNYRVSSNVYLSSDIIEDLRKCGFRNFPKL